jgi:ketosteroid isomerase-like protein
MTIDGGTPTDQKTDRTQGPIVTGVEEEEMTEIDCALALARAFLTALNGGDREGLEALLAENVTQTQPLDDEALRGPRAVVADIWSYRNSFPVLQIEVVDGFAAGQRAALQYAATGTYEPYTYGSRAPRVTWLGAMIVTAQAEELIELDLYVDWLVPIEQLGGDGIIPVLKREGTKQRT